MVGCVWVRDVRQQRLWCGRDDDNTSTTTIVSAEPLRGGVLIHLMHHQLTHTHRPTDRPTDRQPDVLSTRHTQQMHCTLSLFLCVSFCFCLSGLTRCVKGRQRARLPQHSLCRLPSPSPSRPSPSTPPAAPKARRLSLEQRGCVHTNTDLFRRAFNGVPFIPSDIQHRHRLASAGTWAA